MLQRMKCPTCSFILKRFPLNKGIAGQLHTLLTDRVHGAVPAAVLLMSATWAATSAAAVTSSPLSQQGQCPGLGP